MSRIPPQIPPQIPFDLPHREAFEAEDYLVTASNQAAVDRIDRWPDWTGSHCTIFYGAAGCGKTHLTHVWQRKSAARRIGTAQMKLQDIAGNLIIEDIDAISENMQAQEDLFHLYNRQKETGGFLMLTARHHPKGWALALPDLASRMLAAMAIEIGAPDDDLLAALVIKQFMDRQVTVPEEVVSYLLPRIERSFEAVRNIVDEIDTLALARKRKITIPLVRDLLDREAG